MSRNQNHCRHPNLLSLSDRVKVCLDCSVLSFNTSKTDHAKFSFFTKPQLFTQKVETVPLSHFHSLFNQIYSDEDSDEKEFSETYKSIRPKLIHHIKTLCISYRVSAKTLYLALALLDIVAQNITRNSSYLYEVYTTVCFILAMKYIEIDPPTPDYSEFKTLDGRNYIHSTDLYNYEVIILKELDYRLDVVTAYDVLGILFNCGFVYESETMNKPSEFLKTIYNYAKRVLDRAVENSNISEEYNAMQIAFSAIYTARKTFGLNVKCRKDFKAIYGMNYSFYSSCVREIANIDNSRTQYNPTEANTTRKIKKIKLLQTEENLHKEEKEEKHNKTSHSYANSTLTTEPSTSKQILLPHLPPTKIAVHSFKSSKTILNLQGKILLDTTTSTLTAKLNQSKVNIKRTLVPRSSTNLRGFAAIKETSGVPPLVSSRKYKLPKI